MENIIFKTQKSTKQSHVYADGGKKYRLAVLDRSLQTDKYWCAATMETDTQIMSHVAHTGNLHQVSNGFSFLLFSGTHAKICKGYLNLTYSFKLMGKYTFPRLQISIQSKKAGSIIIRF